MSFKHQSPHPLSFSSASSLAPTIVYSTPFTEGVITFPSGDVIYLKLQSRVLEKKVLRDLYGPSPLVNLSFSKYFSPFPSLFFLSSLDQVFSFFKYFHPFFFSPQAKYFPSPNIFLLFLPCFPSPPWAKYFPSPNIVLLFLLLGEGSSLKRPTCPLFFTFEQQEKS